MSVVTQVITALTSNGIPASRAYPSSKMPALTQASAAVGIYRADESGTQVLVTVVASASMGGAVCEDTAITVGNVLRDLGAKWEQRGCGFDRGSQQFFVEGYATFSTAKKVTVTLAGTVLSHVNSVTIWRETDKEVTALENAIWRFRLEEVFPTDTVEVNPAESFTMVVSRGSQRETCSGCVLTAQRREAGDYGVRYIREGKMQSYAIS